MEKGGEIPYIRDVSTEPVVTRLEFNENTPISSLANASSLSGLEVVKSKQDELESVDIDFKPKTIQQLAEQSSSMDYMKTKDEISEQLGGDKLNLSDLIDVFDLSAEEDNKKSLGAVEHLSDSNDFLLGIQDIS
jgi:hypothetical protein